MKQITITPKRNWINKILKVFGYTLVPMVDFIATSTKK